MAAEQLFMVHNSTRATTAAPVKQPTGSAVRTMLQLATATTKGIYIVEWGISFDGFAAAAPVQVELFGCTGAATMSSALAATDAQNMTNPGGAATVALQYGTALSGFATGAVTEGTVANYRPFDLQLVAPTSQYVKQFPLGREPSSLLSTFVRVRVTAAATVNAYIYIVFGEQ
jgi:hypothetical protein